jgi:TrmH family RNA methyltransferase
MTRPTLITSIENPRVKRLVRLRQQRERRQAGVFIAEGLREITRAAAAGLDVLEVYVCPGMMGERKPGGEPSGAEALGLPPEMGEHTQWFQVTEAVLRKAAYQENPAGILAVVREPQWTMLDILPGAGAGIDNQQSAISNQQSPAHPSSISHQPSSTHPSAIRHPPSNPPLILVAVGLSKPGNLGAIARSAAAAGAAGLIVADGVVDAFNPNAIRASTGAVFALPIVAASSAKVLPLLRAAGCRIVAAMPLAATWHFDADLTGPVALVVGAEDTGLGEPWTSQLGPDDAAVAIPMAAGNVDSLNASVAAAVLLFEAVRQRTARAKP